MSGRGRGGGPGGKGGKGGKGSGGKNPTGKTPGGRSSRRRGPDNRADQAAPRPKRDPRPDPRHEPRTDHRSEPREDRAPSRGRGDHRPPKLPDGLRMPSSPDRLDGRNLVAAGLTASGRVRQIWLDEGARRDDKLDEILQLAAQRGITVRRVPRQALDAVTEGGIHNGVVGFAEPLPSPTLKSVLDRCDAEGRDPFLIVLDEVQYAQNLGAILRTAAVAGADAVVLPTRRGAPLSPAVQRVAMGGAEQVPLVREGFGSVFKMLRKRAVLVVGAEADGDAPYWEVDMTGPLALVMGGEDRGLGHTARQACDHVVAIPLPAAKLVNSLNVSVAAGLLIFERVRQLGSR